MNLGQLLLPGLPMKIIDVLTYGVNLGDGNHVFVKVLSDEHLYGIGEAYRVGPDAATIAVFSPECSVKMNSSMLASFRTLYKWTIRRQRGKELCAQTPGVLAMHGHHAG